MVDQTELPRARLQSVIAFVQATERLKDTLRSGITSQGRQESTAEHSWRLALMVMLFEDALGEIDLAHLLKLCLIHDLGEALSGDVPATEQQADPDRAARERRDMSELCNVLPGDLQERMMKLWDEYAAGETGEAVLAKAFDKLETMYQHLLGRNPPGFDYQFNLGYGRRYTDRHPLTRELRAMLDTETRARIAELQTPDKGQPCA
ncbi:HD domain-containing protein [Qipengyuania qiaonensis]|uniref:HD domain-containing protein n=1 Tax=Qipengyuania qiaonensis TaxID=2867240 RepID=A0ABS7J9Q7_9SPHN|nr:HD domain-containing protein [Qipengyuania qiaonensis]MBX7481722.1 HD domain-containing protein [Qipengyuania qiaonensis]